VHDDPPARFKDELLSMAQNAGAPVLGRTHIDRFMAEYRPVAGDALHDTLSAERFDRLPPIFLQVCGTDPLRDEALIYERCVREAGGKTKLLVYPGVPHAFWSIWPAWEKSKRFVNETTEGVGWLLKQGKD
jgi:acetyl esterase/lipase